MKWHDTSVLEFKPTTSLLVVGVGVIGLLSGLVGSAGPLGAAISERAAAFSPFDRCRDAKYSCDKEESLWERSWVAWGPGGC